MKNLFYLDNLSLVMISLISFVGLIIASFSVRYLRGDRKQKTFYYNLTALLTSVCLMVSADHLFLFFISWATSNLFLTKLMMHKSEWKAAQASALLARKNFSVGLFFLAIAFVSLYYITGHASIQKILSANFDQPWLVFSSLLIFLTAMTQSALWPFHTWLISSLNSPTPVSALMHAGLINGGGFLLARFAPLFLQQPYLLHFIFIVGMITTVLGTTWKLMQSDVKRMFACSTMGQMGFMIVQCGLGLFPAAIAHLCFHGFFKAYLFLSSGSAIRQKRVRLERSPKVTHFLLALVCAMFGAYTFALISGKNIFAGDTTLFLIGITFIAGIQCALAILHDDLFVQMPLAIVTNIFFGALYAVSVKGIYLVIAPLNIQKPQPLNLLHAIGFAVLFLGWLIVVFGHNFTYSKRHSQLLLQWYVIMLNASQPHTDTITAHRNDYTF